MISETSLPIWLFFPLGFSFLFQSETAFFITLESKHVRRGAGRQSRPACDSRHPELRISALPVKHGLSYRLRPQTNRLGKGATPIEKWPRKFEQAVRWRICYR